MSKLYEVIDERLAEFIRGQRVFFVATAPLSPGGHVNCSPKGGDCLRILGPREVAYLDYTGSGAETIAHIRENGRIVVMFCAFEGSPKILRLHGHGEVLFSDSPRFRELAPQFPANPGQRAIVVVHADRISTSCGLSVPCFDYAGEREGLNEWAAAKGAETLQSYRAKNNALSIDGLPSLPR
jgi:hypothetical protein